jgi:16S rRNA U1498 N3-methylase RsmE
MMKMKREKRKDDKKDKSLRLKREITIKIINEQKRNWTIEIRKIKDEKNKFEIIKNIKKRERLMKMGK